MDTFSFAVQTDANRRNKDPQVTTLNMSRQPKNSNIKVIIKH